MPLPSQYIGYRDRGRIRAKSIKVWRCDICKSTYDYQPFNRKTNSSGCPNCGSVSIRETRIKEESTMKEGLNSNETEKRTPELVARLMKDGGKVLIVGGTSSDLPKNIINHPQVVIWDDNKQNVENKEVPSNTKIIMYNRWVSHPIVWKLDKAAKSLRAIKFPMLRNNEIKELLSEFIQADAMPISKEEIDKKVEELVMAEELVESSDEIVESVETAEKVEEGLDMSKVRFRKSSKNSGGLSLKEFVAKNLDINVDYSVRGSISKEGERLFTVAKKEGFETTSGSVNQAISVILTEIRKNKNRPVERVMGTSLANKVTKGKTKDADDFEQLDVLIQDAIAAMKLVQEHLPKVKKETERLRSLKDKMLKILE